MPRLRVRATLILASWLSLPPAAAYEAYEKTADQASRAFNVQTPKDLLELSARWRTTAQLERIEAAPDAQDKEFDFVVIGDAEAGRFFWSRWLFDTSGTKVFWKQLDDIRNKDALFVMQLGDMVSRGTSKNYRKFFRNLNDSGITHPYLTAIGNHDRNRPHGKTRADIYPDVFGKADYYFDAGGVRFVVVDSSLKRVTLEQIAWLDAALDVPSRKIVFTHMPPASLKPWTFGNAGFKEGANEFVALMARRRVDRVFVGHVHGFGAMEHLGVRYVLSAAGGSPLFPSGAAKKFYHYITVHAGPEGFSETVHPLKGEPFPLAWDQPLVSR